MSNNQKLIPLGQRNEQSHSCKAKEDDEDLFPDAVPAIIFDTRTLNEKVPPGFNAVRIPLDATLRSDLLWKQERQAAEKYIQQGLRIFWDIHFGLFNLPIANQPQFLSLSLALEHFRDTLWKEFRQQTVGLCLYRGSANFSLGFVWNEEQLNNLREWLKNVFIDIKYFVSETLCVVSSFSKRLIRKFYLLLLREKGLLPSIVEM